MSTKFDAAGKVELAFFLVFVAMVFASILGLCYLCKNSNKILKTQGGQDTHFQLVPIEEVQAVQVTMPADRRRG